MNLRLLTLCLFLSSSAAHGQQVQFDIGGKLGVPITRGVVPLRLTLPGVATTTGAWGTRVSGGLSGNVIVDDRLAVDVDVIFRPVRYETKMEQACCSEVDTVRATALEIPIFASYHFGHSGIRPYFGAGLVPYEKQWGRIDARNTLHNQGDRQTHVVFTYPGSSGSSSPPALVIGGGAAYSKGKLLFRPELRYTRWRGQLLRQTNQWDIFLGITFSAFRLGSKKARP